MLLSSTGEPAGGAVNANYSFPFPQPAGDAAIDGVDLYIDQGGAEDYDELAGRLFSQTSSTARQARA